MPKTEKCQASEYTHVNCIKPLAVRLHELLNCCVGQRVETGMELLPAAAHGPQLSAISSLVSIKSSIFERAPYVETPFPPINPPTSPITNGTNLHHDRNKTDAAAYAAAGACVTVIQNTMLKTLLACPYRPLESNHCIVDVQPSPRGNAHGAKFRSRTNATYVLACKTSPSISGI